MKDALNEDDANSSRIKVTRMTRKICVVGLGYVGLPVAVAFAKKFPVIGFDINQSRIHALRDCIDHTGEVDGATLSASKIHFCSDAEEIPSANFYIVTVPTPIDENACPDLAILESASRTVGKSLTPGDIVVYESTVYPGVTEEVCGPILEKESGLKRGEDFFIGYSPERINPGDKEHTFENIVKIVSGENEETLNVIADTYGQIVKADIHRAPSIAVAETAKVLENTQRDLNIALMNEVALILDRMDIPTQAVLEAAGTKWNFLNFRPGLVGGHCIGVDPYYLTAKAKKLGYDPEVILSGRKINDSMGTFVAQRVVKLLAQGGFRVKDARVGILGLTFKENVPDLRNSRIPDIIAELQQFGIAPMVHDAVASDEAVMTELGYKTVPLSDFRDLDGLILAVNHRAYTESSLNDWASCLRAGGVFVDVKSVYHDSAVPRDMKYWAL
jgi:UDP-N-acetyl-D-glucosamine/UDP-N-acetyl-D-galactosamine dehydrogenase